MEWPAKASIVEHFPHYNLMDQRGADLKWIDANKSSL